LAFLQQVRAETAKVTWPTRRETVISSIMVIIMVIIVALFFFTVDQILGWAMGLILKGVAGTDAAFLGTGYPGLRARLQKDGLLRDGILETDWIGDKYALDIDGYSNTWTNFLLRLHFGCCVLKVDSQHGYRQWYYDRIRPWEHFVPVKADMTDLVEKIDWARSHDAEARRIAENGQAFARSMTFEGETEWAVNAICAANGASPT
jgi:preprotein translocase SecE subunit